MATLGDGKRTVLLEGEVSQSAKEQNLLKKQFTVIGFTPNPCHPQPLELWMGSLCKALYDPNLIQQGLSCHGNPVHETPITVIIVERVVPSHEIVPNAIDPAAH